ncbi:FUSC family protein [Brevibacillus sp. 7WMA2]|uniref:FUSC family protein n=1 Tax=Brevibacillus TaxID=55080 RepID=UPI0013A797D1|nr:MULTISPECIES: FUSC family protein [Brevibacillus]MCR8996405.1 FUSC family protein [Brevibacillus laterosporus]QIC06350.1 FUSC family protein [Brevibacillus sp. 7WMA2]WPS87228.1 FUSC family protein [Brevibacillus halotolerans]
MVQRSMNWCARFGLTFHVCKTVLASGLSLLIASLLFGNHFAYFAPLAAVLTMQLTIADTLEKGIYRVIGVIGGVVSSIIILPYFENGILGLVLVLLVGMGTATALRLNPQIISQIGVSSVMVMTFQQMQGYSTGRILETIIGAIVAVFIQMVIRPENYVPTVQKKHAESCKQLAQTLTIMATALNNHSDGATTPIVDPASLLKWNNELEASLKHAKKSLKYNVFYRKDLNTLYYLEQQIDSVQKMLISICSILYTAQELKYLPTLRHTLDQPLLDASAAISTYGAFVANPSAEAHQELLNLLYRVQQQQSQQFITSIETAGISSLREVGCLYAEINRMIVEMEYSAHVWELSTASKDCTDERVSTNYAYRA